MVTKAYLDSQEHANAIAFLIPPRTAMAQDLTDYYAAGLPDWNQELSSFLARSIAPTSEYLFVFLGLVQGQIRRSLLYFAQGEDLDRIGAGPPYVPRLGRPDAPYRLAIQESQITANDATLDGMERKARTYQPLVHDIQMVNRANPRNVDVYALKADHVELTADETTDLQNYLNRRNVAPNGSAGGFYLSAPTEAAFTIAATVTYLANLYSSASLELLILEKLGEWLDEEQRIGGAVYVSDIITRIKSVEGVVDVSVTTPSANLPSTNGVYRTCEANATDVTLTWVAA